MFFRRFYKQRFVPPVRKVIKSSLKLTIELVPEPCWYSNLRNAIPQSAWANIRKQVFASYNHQCGICGAKRKKLHCHEIWQYDDWKHIQRLLGFIALCPLCHHCKHIGHARHLAEESTFDFQRVIDHFCQVNECSYQMFKAHEERELKRYAERNRYRWRTDLGDYASLIQGAAPFPRELPEASLQTSRQEDVLLEAKREVQRARSLEQWRELALRKWTPHPEQRAELEEEFYRQLEEYGYVKVGKTTLH